MDELLPNWRMGLALALVMAGSGLVLAGVWSVAWCDERRRRRSWLGWALTYLHVFRRVVVGVCLVGAGLGLAEGVPWLLAASVCVGIGEWLESSYYINVIRWGHPSTRAAPEARPAAYGVASTSFQASTCQLLTMPASTNGSPRAKSSAASRVVKTAIAPSR
jgi:hypothetical protein